MDRELPIHPLETFPRQELSFQISRKMFFTTLAAEIKLLANETSGASAVRIPTLGSMTDSQLMDFIPLMLPGFDIEMRGNEVWGKLEGWSAPNFLFHLDHLSAFWFNQVNGKNSLEVIADAVADESALPFERAFAVTRGMFLTLVRAGVCLPVDNPLLGWIQTGLLLCQGLQGHSMAYRGKSSVYIMRRAIFCAQVDPVPLQLNSKSAIRS
jgi:hypothetical protein